MDLTEEWREGSVEERLEYALVKVTAFFTSPFSCGSLMITHHACLFKQLQHSVWFASISFQVCSNLSVLVLIFIIPPHVSSELFLVSLTLSLEDLK